MNTFVDAATNKAITTTTENGDKTYSTSLSAVVDLFFQGGAVRKAPSRRIEELFAAAYGENPYLAVKTALYLRDIRGGAGERRVFRVIIKWLEMYQPDHLMRILHLIPIVGRWDDVFEILDNPVIGNAVLSMYEEALLRGDGLAAKWAPREKQDRKLAARLRNFMGLTPRSYRKLIASASNTVEQLMCAKEWGDIVYSHVPSVASARYSKAFLRNDTSRYKMYLDAVRTGKIDVATGKVAKINTSAVFPYDVIKNNVSDVTADTMWNNLPDYVPAGLSMMPIVDVSGSMNTHSISDGVTAMTAAVSLGIYLAERNKSAFKDLGITFSSTPKFFKLPGGTIRDKVNYVMRQQWSMTTDLDAALMLVLKTAIANQVPQEDMPTSLIVLSDMEFNAGSPGTSAFERAAANYQRAGYRMPNIVWWNIASRKGSTPVRFDQKGCALVSGLSPEIVKSLLGGSFTPLSIMLRAVDIERYDH